MTESDKERLNKRIFGEVLIWDYLKNDNDTADIGADIKITESPLYDRISQYALLHGEDLQGMFKNEKYEYISCVIRDVAAFRTEFENEEVLDALFNHGKGETVEYLISFPEKAIIDDKQFNVNLTDWIKQVEAESGENAFYHPNTEYFKVMREISKHETEFIANSGDLIKMAEKYSVTYSQLNEEDKEFVDFRLSEEVFSVTYDEE